MPTKPNHEQSWDGKPRVPVGSPGCRSRRNFAGPWCILLRAFFRLRQIRSKAETRMQLPRKCSLYDGPDRSQAQFVGYCRVNEADIKTKCGGEIQSCKQADVLRRVLLEREKRRRGRMARYLLNLRRKLSFW